MPPSFTSLRGQLLLDGGNLTGSYFHHTVVLICQHDAEGAFGLVLNRAARNRVGEVLVANLPDTLKQQTLFLGGPVQPSALSYLYSQPFLPEANVIPNLNLGHSVDELIALSESLTQDHRVRIFAGYAGWSPGQLENEMKNHAWLAHPATLDLVFDADPKRLWRDILRQKPGWNYRLLAEAPDDLSWN